jgi:hypothetical protein
MSTSDKAWIKAEILARSQNVVIRWAALIVLCHGDKPQDISFCAVPVLYIPFSKTIHIHDHLPQYPMAFPLTVITIVTAVAYPHLHPGQAHLKGHSREKVVENISLYHRLGPN